AGLEDTSRGRHRHRRHPLAHDGRDAAHLVFALLGPRKIGGPRSGREEGARPHGVGRQNEGRVTARRFGKFEATLFTAAMIVGTGLYTSLGAATSKAGSGILIAMLLGGLVALSTGISAAQVGVNHPVEGGAFIWNREFGYPTISFIAGCAYLFDGIVGLG